jgi:chemotaxis protein MotB
MGGPNGEAAPPPLIIIRKKGGHAAHHGGAWKVAYADFVTAMMALFIVLWLMNSSEQVRKAISAYFKDPSGTGKMSGSASTGTGETVSINKDDMSKLKERLEQAVKRSPEFEKLKDYVQMSVTGEGLRVELIESERGMFFNSGSPDPTEAGSELIRKLAEELRKMPNDLVIEGYTDARPFSGRGAYSNWDLSTERANAARRLMQSVLRPNQVIQVRGFADQSLHNKEHPEDPSNRRISVIVRYLPMLAEEPPAGNSTSEGKSSKLEH